MKRRAILLLGALAALGAGTTPAAAAQKITITIPAIGADEGPYFIAVQKGYFAAEGLDVEFVNAGGGIATPGLLSGTVDGSASPAAALTAILRGAPLRVALVFEDTPPYQIWASAEIRTLADLKGKSVGIATRGDTLEIAIRLALQAAGIAPDSVGYTPLGTGAAIPAALDSGELPAAVVAPNGAIAMQDQGRFKNVHMIVDLAGKVHMPVAGFAVSEKLLYGDPVLAKKIIRAIVKGGRYQKAFKSQTVAIVGKYQTPPHQHANEVEYEYFMRAATPDLTFGNDAIAVDLGVRAGLIGLAKEKIPAVDKIYDFSLARAVNGELNATRWKPVA